MFTKNEYNELVTSNRLLRRGDTWVKQWERDPGSDYLVGGRRNNDQSDYVSFLRTSQNVVGNVLVGLSVCAVRSGC